MKRWPLVGYGHIFWYFIERRGLYICRQLMQWKRHNAYNYFQNEHVKPVRVWCNKTRQYFGGTCESKPNRFRQLRPIIYTNGKFITSHCMCMADEYMTKCNKLVFKLIELLTNLQIRRRVLSFASNT